MTETITKTVKGFYFALALAYGYNGNVSTVVRIGDKNYKNSDKGKNKVLSETKKFGYTFSKKKISASAYADVEYVTAECGPYYHN